ncbi:MAG: hypothetical protein RLZZ579_1195 [Actinomycetota bacterium]
MTNSKFERFPFSKTSVDLWSTASPKATNWPIVYTINNDDEIYVGETTNGASRMRQHIQGQQKNSLKSVTVVFDDSFNKSVCLDLESHLIRYFAADEKFKVLNGNSGITEADYFQRAEYRQAFAKIFDELLEQGLLTKTVPELINSDFFKYSPFKALTNDQAIAIEQILETLFSDIETKQSQPLVVQGNPGTGKTIVAVYLIKLLRDIQRLGADAGLDEDKSFSDFFQPGYAETLRELTIGFVVPQQSLRKTLQKVFKKTPGLDKSMVVSPFDLGKAGKSYDLLVVDEAHRLRQRSNQEAASQNKSFHDINLALFGEDDQKYTQLDWVRKLSNHQVLLVDIDQTVRPGDLSQDLTRKLVQEAKALNRFQRLVSQMRIPNGADYVEYVTNVFSDTQPETPLKFGEYEIKFFESFTRMNKAIMQKENEAGLSRLIAGYGWPWLSQGGKADHDFVIDEIPLIWNRTATDWINSPTSHEEVGSIHTVQGYDLNYAGVIVGPELGFDQESQSLVVYKEKYHDKKGKQNNPGRKLTDSELLGFICNVYRVLMTRGIKGTYIYVVDPDLRDYLKKFFPSADAS